MGQAFRRANTEATKVYTHPNGEDFIEVRSSLTKAEANEVLSKAPQGVERDMAAGFVFLEIFFEHVIVKWSVTDDDGNPVVPTVEEYRQLESVGAQWIETTITEHLNYVLGRENDRLEENSNA